MNPAVEWVTSPSRPRELFLQPRGEIVGEADDLVRTREHELARMQDERLIPLGLHEPREIGLFDGRVDVRVPVVLEHPEEAVETHVDTRRLHHGFVVRIDPHPTGVDLGPDVLV